MPRIAALGIFTCIACSFHNDIFLSMPDVQCASFLINNHILFPKITMTVLSKNSCAANQFTLQGETEFLYF